ncbi:MAG: hypothetical protein ABIQ95_13165 [Bdellovibrionia bacterium]
MDSEPCNLHYWYGYFFDGTRLVTSHLRSRTTHFVVDFKTPGQDETLAQFTGAIPTKTSTEVDIGPCISP